MKYATLAQVRSYYDVAAKASLAWRSIDHTGLERFTSAIYELSRLARRADDETGWREFLYPARRARNLATTVPLPFAHRDLGVAPLLDQLDRQLSALRVYGGEDAGDLGATVVEAGRDLIACDDAPLLEALLASAPPSGRAENALVLPIAEYAGVVEQHLRESVARPDIAVVARHHVANLVPVGRLVVVGPLYWYDGYEYVLTSPRAPHVVVLKWSWYREHQPRRTALEGSRGGAALRVRPLPAPRSTFTIDADDERTSIDWRSVSRELSDASGNQTWEQIPARPAVLAGRHAVLLPEDGDRLVWLLDPLGPAEHRVARVDVADLEPGHVIVLRTSGGGDLIVPIADEILGGEASDLRALQRLWKSQLRSWVRQYRSIRRAAAELRSRGCTAASSQTLRNWLGERSLRTEDRHDWQVLMDACSLGADADRIWRAMSKLHSAHSEAGRSIGRRLREMANTGPLDSLLSTGMQTFSLARRGSVTAFRIEGFSPTVIQSEPNRLMVPTKVRDEWLT